ncbi:MAG TPA: hypothetical protein VGP07_17980 [Polyangia bacterium]|jgi:hypothetical protein
MLAPPPPPPPPVAAPPPPPPSAPSDAAGDKKESDALPSADTGAADLPAEKPAAASGDAAAKVPAEEAAAAAPPVDANVTADADAGTETNPDCALAEKDMSREAWRRNWPTTCLVGDTGKAFILIPIKGSIENGTWELRRKPVREARINLPQAESQLTLKLYKLKRMGFKDLKIGGMDDGNGTRFRVRLQNGAGDPVFDVKDGYAKITVAIPTDKDRDRDKD